MFRVTLVITLSKSYPKSAPLIELDDKKGLSEKEIGELKLLLADTAASNLGDVMIHELATAAEGFLEAHNRKPETFYEKMQNRQRHEQAALNDLREGTLFSAEEKAMESPAKQEPMSTPEEISAMNLKATMDLRKQLHTGERSVSVGSENGLTDAAGGGEDWLNSLLKRQSALNMDNNEEDDSNSDADVDDDRRAAAGDSGSRYYKEFQEMNLLGRGAGGEVWKVKNSLDRRFYAVKKIRLRPTDGAFNSKIRREVTTISRLLHKNIVRYYAAWVEKVNVVSKPVEESEMGSTHSMEEGSSSIDGSLLQKYGGFQYDMNRFQDIDVEFDINAVYADNGVDDEDEDSSESEDESDEDESDEDEDSDSDEDESSDSSAGVGKVATGRLQGSHIDQSSSLGWSGLGGVEFVDSSGQKGTEEEDTYAQHVDCSDSDESRKKAKQGHLPVPVRFLYIQMEFCDATLRAAIDGGELMYMPGLIMQCS
jgi:hypothetical protein